MVAISLCYICIMDICCLPTFYQLSFPVFLMWIKATRTKKSFREKKRKSIHFLYNDKPTSIQSAFFISNMKYKQAGKYQFSTKRKSVLRQPFLCPNNPCWWQLQPLETQFQWKIHLYSRLSSKVRYVVCTQEKPIHASLFYHWLLLGIISWISGVKF